MDEDGEKEKEKIDGEGKWDTKIEGERKKREERARRKNEI